MIHPFVSVPIELIRSPYVSSGAKELYLTMLIYQQNHLPMPSTYQLGADLGVSRTTLWRYMESLEKAGFATPKGSRQGEDGETPRPRRRRSRGIAGNRSIRHRLTNKGRTVNLPLDPEEAGLSEDVLPVVLLPRKRTTLQTMRSRITKATKQVMTVDDYEDV